MKTITVHDNTWQELTKLKAELMNNNLDQTIRYLLEEPKLDIPQLPSPELPNTENDSKSKWKTNKTKNKRKSVKR